VHHNAHNATTCEVGRTPQARRHRVTLGWGHTVVSSLAKAQRQRKYGLLFWIFLKRLKKEAMNMEEDAEEEEEEDPSSSLSLTDAQYD
jgi:hypothetical protein